MQIKSLLLVALSAALASAAALPARDSVKVPRALLQRRCEWQGHCAGDRCANENDCDGDLTCVSGFCGGPPSNPGNPGNGGGSCSWKGHCAGDRCSNENDCDGSLTCTNGICGGGSGGNPGGDPGHGGLPGNLFNWQAQPGSIFRFGDPTGPRREFYNSGSCGLSTYFRNVVPESSNIPLVAMPISVMQNFGESQHNKLCGKTISIMGSNGVVRQAAIADTNMSWGDNSIDMTLDLWQAFGGHDGDGSLLHVQWKLN